MEQIFRMRFADGAVELSEAELAKYAEFVGLSRVATGRYTWGFVAKLYAFERANGIDPNMVVDEIKQLEGAERPGGTKRATQFTRAPLAGLWHQHFFSPRFIPQNLLSELNDKKKWALATEQLGPEDHVITSADLDKLAYALTTEAFEKRYEEGRLTGEWIIFAQHEGQNYYLTLAVHSTGEQDQILYNEVKTMSSFQFPFLFS